MNSRTIRKGSILALTAVGLVVAANITPSKRRSVYWGITDQLDQYNSAIEVGEDLREMGHKQKADEKELAGKAESS